MKPERAGINPVKADWRLKRVVLETDWRPERAEVCKGRVAA